MKNTIASSWLIADHRQRLVRDIGEKYYEVEDSDGDGNGVETETETEPDDRVASHLLRILPPESRKLLWEKRNPTVVKATTNLSILALFVSQIQLEWLSPHTSRQSNLAEQGFDLVCLHIENNQQSLMERFFREETVWNREYSRDESVGDVDTDSERSEAIY